MRIVRFSPTTADPSLDLGTDPLYGVLADGSIAIIAGDPLYAGIKPTGKVVPLSQVRLLAPVLPRSKVVCIGKTMLITPRRWAGKFLKNPSFS